MKRRIIYFTAALVFMCLLVFVALLMPALALIAVVDPDLFEDVAMKNEI